MKKIQIVGVIGSGTMGRGIAQVVAAADQTVILYDQQQTSLDNAKVYLNTTLQKQKEKGKLTTDEVQKILSRINFSSDMDAVKNCHLVIESVYEDLDLKKQIFSELENIVNKDCVLASNTSSLSITALASACKNSARVIGTHFFNPAPIMPLVEIAPAITTDTSIVAEVASLITNWGKVVVMTDDSPGFIVNRVARPYYGESIRIYEEGIADIATIDWAMKEFGNFKMGPFELMDFIGNDVNYRVTELIWEQFFYEPRFKPSLTQKKLCLARFFGRKSGKGYYDYTAGAITPQPKKDPILGKYIFDRVIAMLINEAVDALYYQLATKEDIDLAVTKGVNYPKGLLRWSDEIGLNAILHTLELLHQEYNEDRYRSSVLMKKMVKEKKRFY